MFYGLNTPKKHVKQAQKRTFLAILRQKLDKTKIFVIWQP